MKHKTFKRLICFLLALVVMVSLPLDLQANAVAIAPWAVYALITYMAAVGITFTVSGGVDAMVKAVQDKVDEYQQVVVLPYNFWEVLENGVKLQPPPNGGPNWNPNRGKFFFVANAAAAVTSFITWLVSDGGWSKGSTVEESLVDNYIQVSNDKENYTELYYTQRDENGNLIIDSILPKGIEMGTYEQHYLLLYTPYGYNGGALTFSCYKSLSYYFKKLNVEVTDSISGSGTTAYLPSGKTIENVVGCGITNKNGSNNRSVLFILFDDGTVTYSSELKTDNLSLLTHESNVTTDIPLEIPQFQPNTEQGVYIDTSTDAESLEDLANNIKTQFEETGTIPQPVPEVITDPDFAPEPTPAPTPVVPLPENPTYDDIDGLGLPSLGDALLDKFPFCLPSDIGRLIDIFKVERQTPVWEVDLYEMLGDRIPFAGDTALSIDLTEYEELGVISRWVTTIGFCLFLLLITRQMITW